MLPATLSRFHVVLAITVLLWALALWWHSLLLFTAVSFAFLATIGFGVTIPQLRLFGQYICRAATSGKCVALTFDDGPDPRSTPALLDLLHEAKVTAAFFCVGERVAANPELAARIVREGHLLRKSFLRAQQLPTNFFTWRGCGRNWRRHKPSFEKSPGSLRSVSGRRWACRIREYLLSRAGSG